MVLVTWEPCKKAPRNPKIQIRTMACLRLSTLEPTAVPKELAASLAPIDQPTPIAINKVKASNNTSIRKGVYHLKERK